VTSSRPAQVLGLLGGGQLGMYAVLAARRLGLGTVVLDPDPLAPAARVADRHLVAGYDDGRALDQVADACDVVTTEFENPPVRSLERIAAAAVVRPAASAVAVAQDRVREKAFLVAHRIEVAPHLVLTAGAPAPHGAQLAGCLPGILKTARLGYDGRGQRRVASPEELHAAWAELGGVTCVLEQHLDLDLEVSVVLARAADGRVVHHDLAENHHVDGILDLTVVPARAPAGVVEAAHATAARIADALDYVGVLTVELFVVGGRVLVNELAPRPHNSGHWTLDAAITSQFEQQVRAACGLPLGDPARTAPAVAMVNLLGDLWDGGDPDWGATLADPGARLHLYGKAEARPRRKMGHVTVAGRTAEDAARRALACRSDAGRGVRRDQRPDRPPG